MGTLAMKSQDLEEAYSDASMFDDAELARRALTNDRAVWNELVRRFEPVIRTQLGRTLAAGKKLVCNDSVDDALGEYWIALLKNDRDWLRRFDPDRESTLASWLGLLAWDVANKHLRTLRRHRSGRPMDGLDLEREPWHDRGARFLAAMKTIQPEKTSNTRRPKWR